MAVVKVKIPRRYQHWLFSILALAWCSGILFFYLSRWVTVEGDFGPEKHPLQFPVLMVHGAAAFLIMVSYGSVLTNHVPVGWKTYRLRGLGLSLAGALVFQIFSAYLLYYLANEDARWIVSNVHAGVGFCLPFLLIAHISVGIRTRYKAKAGFRLKGETNY